MNFARDVLDALPPRELALVELARDGTRREWSFGEVSERSARLAGTLARRGVARGDVVMTLIGNRPEWVLTMLACFRLGAVVLPCTEQLRAKDLRLRLHVARPRVIVADERNRAELQEALRSDPDVLGQTALRSDPDVLGQTALRSDPDVLGQTALRSDPDVLGQTALRSDPDVLGQTALRSDPDVLGQTALRSDPDVLGQTPPRTRRDAAGAGESAGGASPERSVGEGRDVNAVGGRDVDVLLVPDDSLFDAEPAAAVELADADPCLITFTSGTAGEPKAVLHGQRYLLGQRLQATHWLGARAGELVWCTASSGWSKSARNVFIAPWLSGAAALLHDARFDPAERLELLARERVNVLCMAPTEYRVIAKRAALVPLPRLRGMVAAGEALNPEVLRAWREATGLGIRDGYGQTETGQLTGMGLEEEPRPGSMGRALPGVHLSVVDGELVADPSSVPTFFLGYLGEGVAYDGERSGESARRHGGARDSPGMPRGSSRWSIADRRAGATWRTGDRVREDEAGYLYFEGRSDDVIISAGYRIGPFEVESALVAHPAVAEAAAVAAPDEERGAVVRAVVVLRDGHLPSPELARELQEHAKHHTAPYKYPRIVDFAPELPKTASGKVRRAQLRDSGPLT